VHGIDLIECSRIAAVLNRHGPRFLDRVLTPTEQSLASRFRNPVPFIAGRWAAKEAVLKMLGTGVRGGITWTDVEIRTGELGQPLVHLSGLTRGIAESLGIREVLLSITHTRDYAAASAIGVVPGLGDGGSASLRTD
jgi:holo-[acyl-carrier protein] synthase